MNLHSQAFDTLSACSGRAVAVARCREAEIKLRGSRSEHVQIIMEVVEVGVGDIPEVWTLRSYTQGDPLVKPGTLYLVAACEEAPADWYLVDRVPVEPNAASAALKTAVQTLDERIAKAR